MDNEIMVRLVWQKLARGDLPRALPKSTWGGRCQERHPCAACDQTIEAGAMEVEADCVDGVTRHYHGLCYRTLESARLQLAGQSAVAPPRRDRGF